MTSYCYTPLCEFKSFIRKHSRGENRNPIIKWKNLYAPGGAYAIFITAKAESRALRRSKQTGQDFNEVLKDIEMRDFNDINRKHGPLKKASDAILINNDNLTLSETVEKIISLFKEKKLNK